MDIASVLGAANTGTTDTAAIRDAVNSQFKADASSKLGEEDFFDLLLTQLTNQNPLDPMDDTEFIAQMAQFSSLEQMNNMNSQMTSLTQAQSSLMAQNYLGKEVTVQVDDETSVQGRIDSVSLKQGVVTVQIDGTSYAADKIIQIHQAATTTSTSNAS